MGSQNQPQVPFRRGGLMNVSRKDLGGDVGFNVQKRMAPLGLNRRGSWILMRGADCKASLSTYQANCSGKNSAKRSS
jgi:hypothetical protein